MARWRGKLARHASATEVQLSLRGRGHRLLLRVADNGIGIPPLPQRRGFGLIGVRERAQRHGGQVAVESGPDGTSVTVTIPQGGAS